MKLKFILLTLCIAVLFSVFTHSLGGAFLNQPEYNDFCKNDFYPRKIAMDQPKCVSLEAPDELIDSCDGRVAEKFDDFGCVSEYYCETCSIAYDEAQEKYRLSLFLAMSILGIFAIIIALIKKAKGVKEWIFNGFLLGGLISLFVGTIIYFGDAPKVLRPIIMFVELAVVIFVALKKIKDK